MNDNIASRSLEEGLETRLACNMYKASIIMPNKQECVAWSVGLCQLFKEPLVHTSMHLIKIRILDYVAITTRLYS